MTNIILALIVGFVFLFFFVLYNRLVTRRNQIENAISSTDALFIKRSDLIPNLIATTKKYMQFEKDTLEKLTSIRSLNAKSSPELEAEAQELLRSLKVQFEAYPELKSSNAFQDLMYSMNEVEEQISAGRRYISASITDYNNAVISFPSNIVAKITGFSRYEWQYASATQRESINADALFGGNDEK